MRNEARVIAVCTSAEKGTQKSAIVLGVLEENSGFRGDAHACGESHRQVSLLASESVDKMRRMGLSAFPGIFAENIVTEGIDLTRLRPGECLRIGNGAMLEITQIGKECHRHCEVYRRIGDCIMPREGVFARVLRGGTVQEGDPIRIVSRGE
jgi:MOSC domain-containing protein YiiM